MVKWTPAVSPLPLRLPRGAPISIPTFSPPRTHHVWATSRPVPSVSAVLDSGKGWTSHCNSGESSSFLLIFPLFVSRMPHDVQKSDSLRISLHLSFNVQVHLLFSFISSTCPREKGAFFLELPCDHLLKKKSKEKPKVAPLERTPADLDRNETLSGRSG